MKRGLLFGSVSMMALVLAADPLAADKTTSEEAFDRLATLKGEWRGEQEGVKINLIYTLTANGSALMEEFRPESGPVMITMFTVDGARMRSHVATLATACLLNLTGTIQADLAPGQQNFADGKIARNDAELFYTIVGTSGDYVLVLSGGPGEDIRSMQGVADELGKKYRCIMWEQRGTGRSKLPKYDSSTINLNAYIEDIEALRKQLHA